MPAGTLSQLAALTQLTSLHGHMYTGDPSTRRGRQQKRAFHYTTQVGALVWQDVRGCEQGRTRALCPEATVCVHLGV